MAVLYLAQLRCVPLSDVLFPELFAGSTEIARHARPPVVFSEDHRRPRFRLQGGVPRRSNRMVLDEADREVRSVRTGFVLRWMIW